MFDQAPQERRHIAIGRVVGVGIIAALFAVLSGCESEESVNEGAESSRSTPSASATTDASAHDDPFITETGVRVMVIADSDIAGQSGLYDCEADAMVHILSGQVVEVGKAPPNTDVRVGEPVFADEAASTPFYETTLIGGGVYRDEDGKLIAGWRHCEQRISTPSE